MTKAQIIERLKAAGVTGWDKKNLAELEAMAESAGVSLVDATGEPEEIHTVDGLEIKTQPAIEGGGFQAVAESAGPERVGFGDTREDAIQALLEDIKAAAEEAEIPADAPEVLPAESSKPDESGAPAEYDPMRLITPQEACSWHGGNSQS